MCLSSRNAKIFPLRGPRGALRAARYAGRATRAGVPRTAQVPYTGGQIPFMKPRCQSLLRSDIVLRLQLLPMLPLVAAHAVSLPDAEDAREHSKHRRARTTWVRPVVPAEGYHLSNGVLPLLSTQLLHLYRNISNIPRKRKFFFSSAVCDINAAHTWSEALRASFLA